MIKRSTTWILAAAGLWLAAGASADDALESATRTVTAAVAEAGPEDEATPKILGLDAFDEGQVLSDEELGGHRARENVEVAGITINDQTQDGNVTDNVATGNTNGDNLINGEAFSDASGFMSTIQNTGNNVLIQNSTIINVSVDTGPE